MMFVVVLILSLSHVQVLPRALVLGDVVLLLLLDLLLLLLLELVVHHAAADG